MKAQDQLKAIHGTLSRKKDVVMAKKKLEDEQPLLSPEEMLDLIPYNSRYPQIERDIEEARFTVLVAHRRFGKTVLSINRLLRAALFCQHERGVYAYVGPYRNQAKNVAWDYLKHYSAKLPNRATNESELCIVIPSAGGQSKVRIFGADNPDALRGLYFDGVILDEVAQMKREVWDEIIQPAIADRQGWVLFIGTPKGVNLFSEVYYRGLKASAKGDPNWLSMSFPVTATQALPDEEVDRLREEMSISSFRREMLCDFTASSDDVLITLDDARAAMSRNISPDLLAPWPLVIGVDVARFGEDASVFFPRRGKKALEPHILHNLSNLEVAQRLARTIAELQPSYVNIDQGQGTGVIDIVRDLCRHDVVISEIPFGGAANDPDHYVNRRAEMWVNLRDWLKSGGCIPENDLLLAELTTPTYSFDTSSRIKLEAKDQVKARLKRSTDLADALALTFAVSFGLDHANLELNRYGQAAGKQALDWLENSGKASKLYFYDPFAND